MGYSDIILLIHNKEINKSMKKSIIINPHFTNEEMFPPATALFFPLLCSQILIHLFLSHLLFSVFSCSICTHHADSCGY